MTHDVNAEHPVDAEHYWSGTITIDEAGNRYRTCRRSRPMPDGRQCPARKYLIGEPVTKEIVAETEADYPEMVDTAALYEEQPKSTARYLTTGGGGGGNSHPGFGSFASFMGGVGAGARQKPFVAQLQPYQAPWYGVSITSHHEGEITRGWRRKVAISYTDTDGTAHVGKDMTMDEARAFLSGGREHAEKALEHARALEQMADLLSSGLLAASRELDRFEEADNLPDLPPEPARAEGHPSFFAFTKHWGSPTGTVNNYVAMRAPRGSYWFVVGLSKDEHMYTWDELLRFALGGENDRTKAKVIESMRELHDPHSEIDEIDN